MKKQFYCPECDQELQCETEAYSIALGRDNGKTLCDECHTEERINKERNKSPEEICKILRTEKEKREKTTLVVGNFNYDEIFSDIFGGA